MIIIQIQNAAHCTNIQMVMSGYQFMNLQFVHVINMVTEHQILVKVLAYRKYCRRWFKYPPWTSQGNNIWIMEFCNHPEKGGQVNQKQSASPHTCILVAFILKWQNKTSLHVEILSFIYKQKIMKQDENKTLHWIMRWGWMRWKQNLAFNNDDVKNYTENYL